MLNPVPRNLWYYPHKDHPGIELPIATKEAPPYAWFRFSRFANSYVLRRDTPAVRAGMTNVVWLLALDGTVTTVSLPMGPWVVGYHYLPTRAGMFFSSDRAGSFALKDAGHAGGYLLNGVSVRRLFAGMVRAVDVAPDGCRIAAVIDPWIRPAITTKLHVLNICDEGAQ
jgi:hypothetical protein